MNKQLESIGGRIRIQDNRCTSNPMFCVQEKKRDVGYDSAYATQKCWHSHEDGETVYDNEPSELDGWEEFGYVERWETVMVAFTEIGCQEYINLNGHNHSGELRIYVDSFNRCPEMIAIREYLMGLPPQTPSETSDPSGE